MRRTKVFATNNETKEIADLAEQARTTPVIALSMEHGLDRGGFAGEAWSRVNETIYKYALAHELPEIKGWYGFDPASGEFLDN